LPVADVPPRSPPALDVPGSLLLARVEPPVTLLDEARVSDPPVSELPPRLEFTTLDEPPPPELEVLEPPALLAPPDDAPPLDAPADEEDLLSVPLEPSVL
jgi:hypothetical protein